MTRHLFRVQRFADVYGWRLLLAFPPPLVLSRPQQEFAHVCRNTTLS